MPRTARLVDPQGVYHVICRGNNKAMIFHDARDKVAYRTIVRQCKDRLPFRMFHYVLMGNHVHFLIGLQLTAPLSEIMKRISQNYSQYYARRYGHVGHLWQDRFKSIAVTDDSYLLTCGIYIEMNPVRAGLTRNPEDFASSSYRHYAFGSKDDLVDDDPLYSTLGNNETQRQVTYQRLCMAGTVPTGTVPGG